jgi:hypothetical protein
MQVYQFLEVEKEKRTCTRSESLELVKDRKKTDRCSLARQGFFVHS